MGDARVYARNLFATWFGYVANLAVMFFLTRYVIGVLGTSAYGIWVLLVGLTGYLGLVEMGIRPSMGRFINYYLGRKEPEKVNAVISTAMMIFLVCGLLLLIVAVTLNMVLGGLFPKLGDMVGDARMVILLTAANLFLSFYGAAFLQVLVAHERFDITNAINLIILTLRTAGMVVVLYSGYGIVEMAWVLLGAGAVQLLMQALAAWRVFPALRISPKLASWACFRELFVFSIWAFLSSVSIQLLYWADQPMIAAILTMEMVAVYNIGSMLVMQARQLMTELGFPFSPQILQDCATKNFADIRRLVTWSTNLIMSLSMLLFLGFVFFGGEFLWLWLMQHSGGGADDGGPARFTSDDITLARDVMIILALAQLAATSTYVLSNVYNGLNRVRFAAVLTFIQSAVSVALMLVLLLAYRDARGAALGVAIPRVVFAAISTAAALRWIQYGWASYASTLLIRWGALAAVFCTVCLTINWLMPHVSWKWFVTKFAVAVTVYAPLAWYILLSRAERDRYGGTIRSKLGIRL